MTKIINVLFFIALVGCGTDKSLDANDYIQAGMFDKAENYYQELIIKERNIEVKDVWKDQLLMLYINSGQLEKADKYASVYFVSDTKMYATNFGILASKLIENHNFLRAAHFFNLSAVNYELEAKKSNSQICNLDALIAYRNAYWAATNGSYQDYADEYKKSALKIVDSEQCESNQAAQAERVLFN